MAQASVALAIAAVLLSFGAALASVCPDAKQNPVVFVPGLCGSVLDGILSLPADVPLPHKLCARKTDKFKVLWVAVSQMLPFEFDCLVEYLSLDFKNGTTSGHAQPRQGVSIRVPDFGGVNAVDRLDPDDPLSPLSGYFHSAIESLRLSGFDEGRTIFAAPYDWRRFPQQQWMDDTRELVEAAYRLSGGHRVVLTAHSMGCPISYIFLMSQTPQWRATYIERWVPVSPVWTGAPIAAFAMLGNALLGLPSYFGKIGAAAKHFESMFFLLPHNGFGTAPVVTTPSHKYGWETLPDVLERAGITWAKAATEVGRGFLAPHNFAHPGVNTTIVWSTGFETVKAMHYTLDAEVGVTAPIPEFGDGDGAVTTESLSYLSEKWSADPATAVLTNKLVVPGTLMNHLSIVGSEEYLSLLREVSCA